MNYSSITQLGLLVIAIAIVFTYTKPTMVEIKSLQDELFQYSDTKDKASEFNNHLASLVATEQSFRKSDIEALETYLPVTVDELTVMSDIEVIVRKNGLSLVSMEIAEEAESQDSVSFEDPYYDEYGESVPVLPKTNSKDVALSVAGDYEYFKALLLDFERNKYPLEVVKLEIGAVAEPGAADADTDVSAPAMTNEYKLTLRTYAFDYAAILKRAEEAEEANAAMESDGSEFVTE